MKRDLSIRALDMAVALRKPLKGCIHHSDYGSQYCSHDYQKRLRQHGFKASMRGKESCHDNAVVETFFKTTPLGENTFPPARQCKAELIWRHPWYTRRAAELATFEYINRFYNLRRKHSALGWKCPLSWIGFRKNFQFIGDT